MSFAGPLARWHSVQASRSRLLADFRISGLRHYLEAGFVGMSGYLQMHIHVLLIVEAVYKAKFSLYDERFTRASESQTYCLLCNLDDREKP